MSTFPNLTKDKLAAGELALGLGLRNLRTVDAALAARTAGFDWLFIDMEHGSYDLDVVCQIAVAALPTGVTPIVRVPGHQHFHCARALDGGAMGVVVPHVDTVEQARHVVNSSKFPPIGHRSMIGALPQLAFASTSPADIAADINATTLVVVMIETPAAVENADAIAAVDGVDVLLIGTNDLCAEMGIHGQFGDQRVVDAYREVIAAASAHGKSTGMGGVYDDVLSKRYIDMGARFILAGSDLNLMLSAGRQRSAFLRSLEQ